MKKILLAAAACFSLFFCSSFTASAQDEGEMIEKTTADADPRLAGEWLLYNLNSKKVEGDERPYITLELNSGRLYGSNGCNVVNADITCEGPDAIRFYNVVSTKVYCPGVTHEYLFNGLLEKVRYYKISQYGNELYLDLLNNFKQVVMVFRKHNMDFLNGLWHVTEIDGEANSNDDIKLSIDIPLKHLHGRTGCNIVNGDIFIDPDKGNSMSFQRLASTRRACPELATETRLLIALEEVEFAVAEGPDRVKMLDKRGHEVLQLQRIK